MSVNLNLFSFGLTYSGIKKEIDLLDLEVIRLFKVSKEHLDSREFSYSSPSTEYYTALREANKVRNSISLLLFALQEAKANDPAEIELEEKRKITMTVRERQQEHETRVTCFTYERIKKRSERQIEGFITGVPRSV